MGNVILGNAFSCNMLPFGKIATILPVPFEEAQRHLRQGFTSVVGHETTAALLTRLLGVEVKCNRATVTLHPDTLLIVAQYIGPRLPEGATELPVGARFEFFFAQTYAWGTAVQPAS